MFSLKYHRKISWELLRGEQGWDGGAPPGHHGSDMIHVLDGDKELEAFDVRQD